MRISRLYNRVLALTCAIVASLACFSANAQEVYADKVKDSTSDFRNVHRIVNGNRTDYAHISTAISVLNSSHLRVSFPVSGKAGDAVNFTVQAGRGQLLDLKLLSNVTVRLYDSLGAQVAVSASNADLELALLTGDSIFNIRYVTNPAGTFKFKDARIEFNNLLSINLLSEFRIYGIYYQIPCPPTFANKVHAFGTNGLLTGYVSNPNNAVDANVNNYATMYTLLNILTLLPPAYLTLEFPTPARPGEFVGFTIGKESSLLSANLLGTLEMTVYDEAGTARMVKNNFNILDLRLLEGSVDRYVIGLTLPTNLTYKVSRVRLQLNSVLTLLSDLRVYNAFHYQLDRPPVPVTFSRPPVLCQGENVVLTAALTPGAMSYQWSNGATTRSIIVTTPGIYSVTVFDSFACSRRSLDINVVVNPLPVPVIVGDTVSCENVVGTLRTSQTYAAYLWSTGATTPTIDIRNGGTYTVTVADANGCTGTDNVVVVNNRLNITPAIASATCSDGANGRISLAVTGGSNNYSYRWSNGATTNVINNVSAGLYTVNVKDNLQGCSYNKSFTLVANNTLSVKAAIVNTTACGSSDGRVAITVIGGTGNYTYSWSNGATTRDLTNVKAGIYKVTITDGAGCGATHTVTVNDGGSTLVVNGTVNPASSCNTGNGSITLNVSGGGGGYTYLWENGATTANRTNLVAGTYYVAVTQTSTKCVSTKSFEVGNTAQLTVNGTVTPSACGRSTGAITSTVTGGSNSYTYSWSDGATTANRTNLAPGTYVLNVTHNTTGCKGQKVFVVGTATPPAVTLNVTQPACGTNINGAITVTTSGNYQYMWSNNSTVKDQGGLRPGTYTLTVIDPTSFCTATYEAKLEPRKQIQLVAAPVSNTSCAAAANGAIDVTVTGGVSPYSYAWSSGQTTQDLTMLSAGTYTLTTNDANGCSATIAVPVISDSTKTLGVFADSIKLASCNITPNGSVILTVRGGQTPYQYEWSNSTTGKDLLNVLPGNYSVKVTDAVGCMSTLNVALGIDTAKSVRVTIDSTVSAKCNGSTTGSLYVTTSGGKSPYSFMWSNGRTTEDLLNVVAGSYTVTVTDDLGCTAQASANIAIDTLNRIEAMAATITAAKCNGSKTGGVDVTVTGGTPPYSYSWSNGATSQDLSQVEPGNYTLTVNDAAGCNTQLGVNIGVDTANAVTAVLDSIINVGCVDPNSGKIYTSVKGGTSPFTYMWNDGNTAKDRINVAGGTYKLTVTDFVGCKDDLEVTVSNAALLVTDQNVKNISCNGANDGSVMITIGGGRDISYTWSNGGASSSITNLGAGTYTVKIFDNVYKCELNDTFTITQPDSLKATAQTQNDDCFEALTGQIMLQVSGGTLPYKYEWSTGSMSESIEYLASGRYTVTVTDNNNCKLNAEYFVAQNDCDLNIVIHNVFTPNGDGVNDTWEIDGIMFYPGNTIYVYNKWGDLVYNTKNYDNKWTGTNNKGEELTGGTYYYVLKLNQNNKAGGKNEFSGFMMIQR